MKSRFKARILSLVTSLTLMLSAVWIVSDNVYAFDPAYYKPTFTSVTIGAPIHIYSQGIDFLPVTLEFTAAEDLADSNTVEYLEGYARAELSDGQKAAGIAGVGMTLMGPMKPDALPEGESVGWGAWSWSWTSGGPGKGLMRYNIPILGPGETQKVEKSSATGLVEVNGLKVGDKVSLVTEVVMNPSIPKEMLPEGYPMSNEATFTVEDASKYPKTIPVSAGGSTSVKDCTIELSGDYIPYDGTVQKPEVTVTHGDAVLLKDEDYTVNYKSESKTPGTYQLEVTGKGEYTDSQTVEYNIIKGKNNLIAKGFPISKAIKVKASKVKKKKVTVKLSEIVDIQNKGEGKVSFSKSGGSKKITVNKKNGNITIKKGTKPGIYRARVNVKAAGNGNYDAGTVRVWVTVRVRK